MDEKQIIGTITTGQMNQLQARVLGYRAIAKVMVGRDKPECITYLRGAVTLAEMYASDPDDLEMVGLMRFVLKMEGVAPFTREEVSATMARAQAGTPAPPTDLTGRSH